MGEVILYKYDLSKLALYRIHKTSIKYHYWLSH